MVEKCYLEQTKRTRIKGDGPRRHELPIFKKIADIHPSSIDELNKLLDYNPSVNDIGGDNYSITNQCNYEEVFNAATNYRQMLLQHRNIEGGIPSEDEYVNWLPTKLRYTKLEINKYFNQVYRFRLSEMQPEHEINWHIDTDTSVMCRAQICLNDNDSTFEFKDKTGIHQLTMKPGELWFINTGWNHRVVSGTMMRRVAVFSFHYKDLIGGLND